MKRTRTMICCVVLVVCMLVVSCTPAAQTTETQAPQATVSQTTVSQVTVSTTASDPVDVPDTEILTTEADSASAEEDTSSVPSVPYTLEHHVTDLSAELPLSYYAEDYSRYEGMGYLNSFVRNGKLYVYGFYKGEPRSEARLKVFENGVVIETIPVPKVYDTIPDYAYPLSDGRLAVAVETLEWREQTLVTEIHFLIVQPDGQIDASLHLDRFVDDIFLGNGAVINEDADGNVYLLLQRRRTNQLVRFTYDRTSGTIELTENYHISDNITVSYKGDEEIILPGGSGGKHRYFQMAWSVSIGNSMYQSWGSMQYDQHLLLDMNAGKMAPAPLRVPEDSEYMILTYGENGKYYFYDMLAMYEYRDNLPPVKVANWIDCGISPDLSGPCLWVIDSQNYYLKKTVKTKNRTKESLYFIHTEMVPDENPKQKIILDYYGISDWIKDAVFAFNRENDAYEILFNMIDPVNMSREDILDMIGERAVKSSLPDMIITDMAVNFNDYADKGVLLDLKPYFSDRLLGCITDVMDFGGHLYTLPTEMQINTFLCLPEVTEDFLTWDVFMDAAETLAVGEVLFSDERAIKFLRENGIMDFFDFADGRAEYDTDRFREVMTFLSDLETRVDTTAGYVTTHSDGTNGYTNPTLPARLRDGGLTFMNLWMRGAEMLVTARLLYGEEDFVWCGYPSEHGGGANVNALGRIAVNADTEAKEGCLAFVESLLTPEYQTAYTHDNLPITREGMQLLFEKNRYWYYDPATYEAIGDPAAPMREPTMSFEQPIPIVPTSAGFSSDNPDEPVVEGTVIVKLEDADIDAFMHFLDNCHMSAGSDETVEAIVTEELSYWENGVKPLEEVTKIIQSRVGIYLAERK